MVFHLNTVWMVDVAINIIISLVVENGETVVIWMVDVALGNHSVILESVKKETVLLLLLSQLALLFQSFSQRHRQYSLVQDQLPFQLTDHVEDYQS